MLLAGDVGGTKTRLGLFKVVGGRPPQVAAREYTTLEFPSLAAMINDFRKAAGSSSTIDAACFGVAGPVIGNAGHLTNVPWRVDGDEIAGTFGISRVSILNDLEALAHAVPVLDRSERHTLQEGRFRSDGNIAVIAAGTGLGEALLHRVDGRYIPSPGEGGHADFAARNEREIALLRDLAARFGRASVEHVLSGPGLQNIYRMTHRDACAGGLDDAPAAAAISTAALEKRCAACVEALEMFVEAYGAEAGNHALRSLATGGVFIGGGIAPKILPALEGSGRFVDAFVSKPPHVPLLTAMPVHVIINAGAGLIGAAVAARSLASG